MYDVIFLQWVDNLQYQSSCLFLPSLDCAGFHNYESFSWVTVIPIKREFLWKILEKRLFRKPDFRRWLHNFICEFIIHEWGKWCLMMLAHVERKIFIYVNYKRTSMKYWIQLKTIYSDIYIHVVVLTRPVFKFRHWSD